MEPTLEQKLTSGKQVSVPNIFARILVTPLLLAGVSILYYWIWIGLTGLFIRGCDVKGDVMGAVGAIQVFMATPMLVFVVSAAFLGISYSRGQFFKTMRILSICFGILIPVFLVIAGFRC